VPLEMKIPGPHVAGQTVWLLDSRLQEPDAAAGGDPVSSHSDNMFIWEILK